ncbi:polymorphic toxin type 15 domain-containing protein [Listeria booriae]|uniref:polymorphic toxin type 15 domain-containing protein n=1 Tax=Listeria booriae TaxID=1552123 RepID=UPI00288095FE|nr:polymorphic toxin type 15 domain-containing protein [Listeria booriae]MDT0110087.1 polymorphic toxin type 15 domain-containing protein [Listeria booriae]
MSLNVFLSEIDAQSESMVASYHDMIEAMEGLMRAVSEFAFDRELQGKTYDSAKQYFAATYRPLAQGMICLCEELIRQNQAFPQKFRADVATTDVIEHEVRDQIRQLDHQIQDIEKLSNNVVGMALITPIFVDLKQKLQEKLEALYQFDTEAATSFDRAMDLTTNIVQGLAEIDNDKAFQAKTGTFHTMGLNMTWRSALQKQWTAREEAMAKLAKENETARLIKAAEDGPLPVIPEGNVAGFVTKDGKLDGKATYDNAKWQQAHVLAGMKNAIFLIDMVAPIFDIYRWKTGLDPITQEKLSPFDQNEAAAFTALTFIPFGKLGKVAKAIKASTRTDEFKFLFEGVDEIKQAENASKSAKFAKFMKLDKIEVTFKRNPKHDPEEFARQLADQEKGMNELTVSEYLANREKYLAQGRAIEGDAAQKLARQETLKDKVAELRKQGLSRIEAQKKADEWMKMQAALHNPDQIAGGNPLNIGGLGDRKVNSSIGSQWKYRIEVVDEQIRLASKKMTKSELENTYLNVRLVH